MTSSKSRVRELPSIQPRSAGPDHRAGLTGEDLQVVVEFEHVRLLVHGAHMGGDPLAGGEDLDERGRDPQTDPPAGIGDRHGVAALPDTGFGLMVGLDRGGGPGLEGFRGLGQQLRGLGGRGSTDVTGRAGITRWSSLSSQAAMSPFKSARIANSGHGGEPAAPDPADLAFHAALLMGHSTRGCK